MSANKVFGIIELNLMILSYLQATDILNFALTNSHVYAIAKHILMKYCEIAEHRSNIKHKKCQIESLFIGYLKLVGYEFDYNSKSCNNCHPYRLIGLCDDGDFGRLYYQCFNCSYFEWYRSDDYFMYRRQFFSNLIDDQSILVDNYELIFDVKRKLEDDILIHISRISDLKKN
jgi:hypothetical protein